MCAQVPTTSHKITVTEATCQWSSYQSALAHHGTELIFRGNWDGRTLERATLPADSLTITIGDVRSHRRIISPFVSHLVPQHHLTFRPLPIPGHHPHRPLHLFPDNSVLESPPRSPRRLAVSRHRVHIAGLPPDIRFPRRSVPIWGPSRLWGASTCESDWMGTIGGDPPRRSTKWIPNACATAKEAICHCTGKKEGHGESRGLNLPTWYVLHSSLRRATKACSSVGIKAILLGLSNLLSAHRSREETGKDSY